MYNNVGVYRSVHIRIKTENVKESLEPVDVDKAGSEASEERTCGLSKMVALL